MSERRERALVFLLALVGLALRVLAARGMAFWDDDLGTIHEATRIDSLRAFLTACPCSWHPPLSFLVAKAWLALAHAIGPGDELLARAPFLVAGALSVPLAWRVARRLVPDGALLVAALTAANPLLLWCDRDVRGYALLVPLGLATVLLWLRALDEDRPRDWVAFAAVGALAAWDHYNALPLVAALLLVAALERGRAGLARPVLAGALFVALYLPWIPWGLTRHLSLDLGPHQAHVQLSVPPVPLTAPAYVLFGLTLGHSVFPWNALVVVPVALSGGALAISSLLRAKREGCFRPVLLGLALPILGAALTPLRMPRYYVAYAPLLAIVLVSGARARGRAGLVGLAVVALGMAVADANLLLGREHHFLYPLHPWREAARLVHERPAPVVGLDSSGPFAQSYARDLWGDAKPNDRSVWVLVDEKTKPPEERSLLDRLSAAGFRLVEDRALLVDPDANARRRFIGRENRDAPVRLLRLER